MTLRKWILKIHLYGGLICFWYLVILAISSFQFQHHFDFYQNSSAQEIEQIHLDLPYNGNNGDFAISIQDTLGIPGWHLPWETYRDKSGIFHTQIQNPKIQYFISYDSTSATLTIAKKDKGIGSILNFLHGFAGEMPKAPLLIFWKIFTYICLVSVIFSIISGIWLWANRSTDKLIGWLTVLGIMGLSISLMLIVYLKG